jgi:hypothetical protein
MPFLQGQRTVAAFTMGAFTMAAFTMGAFTMAAFTMGCLMLGLTVAGLALKSSLAILAFLVVLRVLIKLFFWILIDGFSPSKFC